MNELILIEEHNENDLLQAMANEARKGKNNSWVLEVSERAKAIQDKGEKLKFILENVYQLAIFRLTPDNRQQLRTVDNIVRNRKANCTQYSTIISSVLLNLSIPHKFRLIDQDGGGYSHVYIIVNDIVLDAVIGQAQNDSDTFGNRKNISTFDQEYNFKHKLDYTMLTLVQGNRAANIRQKNNINAVNSVSTCIDTCIQQGGTYEKCSSYCNDPVEQQTTGGGFNWTQYMQYIPYLSNHICRRECDLQFYNDPDGRLRCKEACPEIQNTQQQPYFYQQQQQQDNNMILFGIAALFLLSNKKK